MTTKTDRIAATVDAWIVPPECAGQIIEYAYGRTADGDIMVRETDRSGPEVRYGFVDADDYQPWSHAPEGAVRWA